jgi:hypothetical protein
MLPRYQIFVSSTFRDLSDERQAVQEAILELNHFPAGMETFPAADSTPWELIESVIADSDYYILIIGGRYGSTGPEGISYTEMEYNLALKLQKPILAFLHAAPDMIPSGKSELNSEARKKLDEFRSKVSSRHCKFWKNKDELKSQVLIAITHTIRTKPACGWIPNSGPSKHELLQQLNDLQLRYDSLQTETELLRKNNGGSHIHFSLQSIDKEYLVKFKGAGYDKNFEYPMQLRDIFFGIAKDLIIPCPERQIGYIFKKIIEDAISGTEIAYEIKSLQNRSLWTSGLVSVDDNELQSILLIFMAADLIEPEARPQTSGSEGKISSREIKHWKLTAAGRILFLKTVIAQ